MRGVALSLGLAEDYFAAGYTADPTVLFRIFHYPPAPPASDDWGVGEHTDYGLLTLLAQDRHGGLQVHAGTGWVEAPPIPGTFVCNIGDMLDRLTGGLYRSTPHRVKNVSGRERLSFPFFFDPRLGRRGAPASLAGRRFAGRDRRRPRPVGRSGPSRLHRHLRRIPPRQGLQGVPAAARGRPLRGPIPGPSGSEREGACPVVHDDSLCAGLPPRDPRGRAMRD